MADNVKFQSTQPATPPKDAVVAADEIGGVLYQRMKLIIGADGANAGDIYYDNPLPVSSVAKNMEGGGKVAIGIAAVEMTFTGSTKSIILSADPANTGTLYVGKSTVTSAGANAIAFLEVGESLTIEFDDDTNAVYVVASIAAQNVWKGALI